MATQITPTTELQAVNQMLSVIGEATCKLNHRDSNYRCICR